MLYIDALPSQNVHDPGTFLFRAPCVAATDLFFAIATVVPVHLVPLLPSFMLVARARADAASRGSYMNFR